MELMDSEDPLLTEKIYTYDNYRRFIKDYFELQKKFEKRFSYRAFARRSGFNSHSYCEFIIKGKRNLTLESIEKMAKGMDLGSRAHEYFKFLVLYNQAKTVGNKEKYFSEIMKIRKTKEFYRLQEDQYKYYSEWYYPVVRELAVYSSWNGGYTKLSNMVQPNITAQQARQAVDFLVKNNFLKKLAGDSYAQADPVVTGEGMPAHLLNAAKTQYILRSLEALENLPGEERHIASSTLAISKNTYAEVTQLLSEIRKKILAAATDDKDVSDVYALNIQLFPLSNMQPESKTAAGKGGNHA